jgi:hypothetical protein
MGDLLIIVKLKLNMASSIATALESRASKVKCFFNLFLVAPKPFTLRCKNGSVHHDGSKERLCSRHTVKGAAIWLCPVFFRERAKRH